jgi:ankyrin repeat protein
MFCLFVLAMYAVLPSSQPRQPESVGPIRTLSEEVAFIYHHMNHPAKSIGEHWSYPEEPDKITKKVGLPMLCHEIETKNAPTKLHYAAGIGCEFLIKVFLALPGIDPNQKDFFGNTPLHLAASNGYLDCVQALLRHAATKINPLNTFNQTPLCCAFLNNHEETALFLREHDAH